MKDEKKPLDPGAPSRTGKSTGVETVFEIPGVMKVETVDVKGLAGHEELLVEFRKARLDADGNAKPLTQLFGVFRAGDCVGPGSEPIELLYRRSFISGEEGELARKAIAHEAGHHELAKERFIEARVSDPDPEVAATAYAALTHLRVLRSGRPLVDEDAAQSRFATLYGQLRNRWNLATDMAINPAIAEARK